MSAAAPQQAVTSWQYLAPNPKSAYKQLFIKGTRIRARVLYGLSISEEDARTPEQLARDYGIPIEAISEAIAYCESNPPEIAEDQQRDNALLEATGMNHPDYKYHGQPKILSAREIARIEGR